MENYKKFAQEERSQARKYIWMLFSSILLICSLYELNKEQGLPRLQEVKGTLVEVPEINDALKSNKDRFDIKLSEGAYKRAIFDASNLVDYINFSEMNFLQIGDSVKIGVDYAKFMKEWTVQSDNIYGKGELNKVRLYVKTLSINQEQYFTVDDFIRTSKNEKYYIYGFILIFIWIIIYYVFEKKMIQYEIIIWMIGAILALIILVGLKYYFSTFK